MAGPEIKHILTDWYESIYRRSPLPTGAKSQERRLGKFDVNLPEDRLYRALRQRKPLGLYLDYEDRSVKHGAASGLTFPPPIPNSFFLGLEFESKEEPLRTDLEAIEFYNKFTPGRMDLESHLIIHDDGWSIDIQEYSDYPVFEAIKARMHGSFADPHVTFVLVRGDYSGRNLRLPSPRYSEEEFKRAVRLLGEATRIGLAAMYASQRKFIPQTVLNFNAVTEYDVMPIGELAQVARQHLYSLKVEYKKKLEKEAVSVIGSPDPVEVAAKKIELVEIIASMGPIDAALRRAQTPPFPIQVKSSESSSRFNSFLVGLGGALSDSAEKIDKNKLRAQWEDDNEGNKKKVKMIADTDDEEIFTQFDRKLDQISHSQQR